MRHLDLFSGIGGFALSAQWVWGPAHEIVSFCEIDKFCQKVLKKHWPDVPIHEDIHTLKGDQLGTIDLITGGFPCQPFSVAGKQRGKDDDRAVWPEMLRVIAEARPNFVIGENVTGIVKMELDSVLSDLEGLGYSTGTYIIPACAVDAPHRRDRVWVVANTKHNSNKYFTRKKKKTERKESECRGRWFSAETSRDTTPRICRNINEIPNGMDRLKGLGNAIVPQVAAVIMQAIKDIDNQQPG